MATTSEEQWKFTIYLVGFPETRGDSTTIPITTMVKTIIPEARVFKHAIFRSETSENPEVYDSPHELADTEDGCGPDNPHFDHDGTKDGTNEEAPNVIGLEDVSKTTVAEFNTCTLESKFFLPEWIDSEAAELLKQIEQHVPTDKRLLRRKVVLAGYGFGGFIVKRAVIMANSSSKFHDLALTIDTLAFIATPHRPSRQLAWEELLLKMLNVTNRSYHGRLSEILSGIIGSVSQLSNVFLKFAAKYRITNFIGKDDSAESMMFNSTFEEVISRPQTDDEIICCSIHDVEYLELIRKAFTPRRVSQDTDIQEHTLQMGVRIDCYFKLLQRLSPSRWLIYSSITTEYMEDFEILKRLYEPFINKASIKEILGCSVEIVSPKIHGGSALLKLLCREIIESSSAVLIESNSGFQSGEGSRYNMYMSFIRQIISQRPSLFLPVQSLATEILSQNIWTEEVLHHLLSSILIHSNGTHFHVAIYDFESWPLDLRSWLSTMQNHISEANGSTISILTCSRNEITGLTREKVHKIEFSPEQHAMYITAFIHEKVGKFLGQNIGSASARAKLKGPILKTAIPLARSFEGSFSIIGAYLMQLLHSIPFTSITEIKDTIQDIPATSETIYKHCLQELFHKPKAILFWATKVLSWLLLAVRPLHIKELAVAVALRSEHLTLHNVRNDISIDMEKDIRQHLGPLVRIEGRFAYLDSPELKNILLLFDKESPKKLNILRDQDIARLSLRYLRLTFARARENKATWENCLSQVSYKRQGRGYDDPDLHFLEYACRFWPIHLHRGKAIDSNMEIEVTRFFTLKSDIPNMWFKLYLLFHGQIPETFAKRKECQDVKVQVLDTYGTVMDERDSYQPQTAVEMADYVGLSTFIPSSLLESEANTSKEITVRRGYWDYKVVLWNAKSRDYLDLIIDNNDTVKEFFSANQKEMSGHFPLHRAAILGCLGATEVLFNLLSNHTSANHISVLSQIDSDGRTPIHVAALCGSEEVLRFLIDKAVSDNLRGASKVDILDVKDNDLKTAFMVAVQMGNVAAAKVLLEFGAAVNIRDDIGRTALHFAASNCPQLIKRIMNQNNDAACMADRDGCTPLHIAIKCGNRDATSLLLEVYRRLGCLSQTVSAKDSIGKTALHYAAEQGFEEISRHLVGMEGIEKLKMDDIQSAAELAAMNGHLASLRAIVGQEEIRDFGHQILNAAVSSGQLLVVCYLLQNNVSPNEKLEDGRTILSIASAKGFAEIVRTMLEHGANVSAVDSDRRTPLHYAAKHGMCEIAEILLAHQPKSGQQAKIEAHDSDRYTPLHYAARAGEIKMIQFLLRKNAKIDALSLNEETPLHIATENPTATRLLLEAGANLEALDDLERTPLHLAVINSSLETARILLEYGASCDKVDYEKKSPMRYAIVANDANIVEAIIQSQIRQHKYLEISWDDIASAFKSSSVKILMVLLNQLPSIIEMRDERGNTLLHSAAEYSDVNLLTLLLNTGSEINALNDADETPLFRAVVSDNIDNLRLLIRRGGKIDTTREDGCTPLHIAAYLGNVESAVALLETGVLHGLNAPAINQVKPLHLAARQDMAEMVELLLKKGADPNVTASGGWSPLQVHISSDIPDKSGVRMCDLLVSYNANINHQADSLSTPLHLAIDWLKEHTMKYLLDNGADPNIPDENGLTAFHVSFHSGLAKPMLEHPKADTIDLEKRTGAGMASIHLAVEKSEPETVQLMLNKGVDFKAKTAQGLSCLDLAAGRDTSDILETLLNKDWDINDIVSAYWSAIKKFNCENVKKLVRKEQRLLGEISDKGLDGLETCLLMRPRTETDKEISLAIYFLENEGNDVLNNRESSKMSIFELCMFSQAIFNPTLLQACLTYLLKYMKTLSLGFRELRAATEVKREELDLWHRLKFLKEQMKEESDQDGWNLHQFLYQAEPRQSYDAWDAEMIKLPTKTPSALIVPPLWYAPDAGIEAPVDILTGGLEARFTRCKHGNIRSIRSDFPFPPRNLGQAYFEVTIHNLEEGGEAEVEKSIGGSQPASKIEPPSICIGFSGEFSIIKNARTGWNMWSTGYHGDDGKVYHESSSASKTLTKDRIYGTGYTVGCGIDYEKGNYFFTCNGEIVSRHESNIIYRKLYPTISHEKGSCKVTVNFGEGSFLWACRK